jgi:hypothetical protein
LITEFLPKVRARHPGYSREKALLIAIAVMEKLIEQRNKKAARGGG